MASTTTAIRRRRQGERRDQREHRDGEQTRAGKVEPATAGGRLDG